MCRDRKRLRDKDEIRVEAEAGGGAEAEAQGEARAKAEAKDKAKAKAKAIKGGVTLLVALYLPVCILAMGMVFDLGLAFVVRQTAQAACDMGALAAVQELDWDQLAEGILVIDTVAARRQGADITFANLAPLVRKGLITEPVISIAVNNPVGGADDFGTEEPAVTVEASMTVRTFFLRWLPGLASGIPMTVRAEARCVERTRW